MAQDSIITTEVPPTLDALPIAVQQLAVDIREIKQTILSITDKPEPPKWLNVEDLCAYHPDKPSVATVYYWVKMKQVPFHRGARKLRFLKSEIDDWLANNDIASQPSSGNKQKGGKK